MSEVKQTNAFDDRDVVSLIDPENVRSPLDQRDQVASTRREGERREGGPGRRPADLAAVRRHYVQAAVGVFAGIVAMVSAGVGLFHPPVTRTASTLCGDGLGGQTIIHRGMSWLWLPAVVGMVIAVLTPHRKKRPVLILFCAGIVIGMAAGALLRVETVMTGLCLA